MRRQNNCRTYAAVPSLTSTSASSQHLWQAGSPYHSLNRALEYKLPPNARRRPLPGMAWNADAKGNRTHERHHGPLINQRSLSLPLDGAKPGIEGGVGKESLSIMRSMRLWRASCISFKCIRKPLLDMYNRMVARLQDNVASATGGHLRNMNCRWAMTSLKCLEKTPCTNRHQDRHACAC